MSDEQELFHSLLITHHSSLVLCRRRPGGSPEAFEGLCEFVRDLFGEAVLDLAAFEHVDELAVTEERDLRRGGRVWREVRARARRRLDVSAGEDRDLAVGARVR